MAEDELCVPTADDELDVSDADDELDVSIAEDAAVDELKSAGASMDEAVDELDEL